MLLLNPVIFSNNKRQIAAQHVLTGAGPYSSMTVVLNQGVATPMEITKHFPRGCKRYLVFVKNPFVAHSDVVNVFSGNDATPDKFIAPKKITTIRRDDVFFCSPLDFGRNLEI